MKKRNSRVEAKLKKNKNNRTKRKRNEKRFSILSIFLKLLVVAIVVLIAIFSCYFVRSDFNISKTFVALKEDFGPKPITVLVLGVSTDISSELADTIMVCSYNPGEEKAYLLSIPRDTFIGTNQNSAKGSDKINSLYTRKGPQEMVKKVEDITGLKIEYYAVVKNQALIDIVDGIGGVNFDVPIDMDYDDVTQDLHIHLEAGMQKIDGEKAEQLLRFRHNNDGSSYPNSYGDNDFGRMKTQRNFMVETAKQTLSLKNIFKFPKIINITFDNIETDLKSSTVIKYIPSALSFNIENIETYQLPGEAKKLNSLWFFVPDSKEIPKIVESIK